MVTYSFIITSLIIYLLSLRMLVAVFLFDILGYLKNTIQQISPRSISTSNFTSFLQISGSSFVRHISCFLRNKHYDCISLRSNSYKKAYDTFSLRAAIDYKSISQFHYD